MQVCFYLKDTTQEQILDNWNPLMNVNNNLPFSFSFVKNNISLLRLFTSSRYNLLNRACIGFSKRPWENFPGIIGESIFGETRFSIPIKYVSIFLFVKRAIDICEFNKYKINIPSRV